MSVVKIPVYRPEITDIEKTYVNDCLDSTWISSKGKYVNRFEQMISEYTGASHVNVVSNGTVALHLALLALDIGPGDEVIVPDFSYIASSNVIHFVGAQPIFVDVSPDDWNITFDEIMHHINNRTKAILFTNVYGSIPKGIERILAVAKERSIFLIEDAAESIGAFAHDMKSGTIGDIATFSFFGNKTITTGEGGAILTSNPEWDRKMRQLKNQGNSETVRYYHDVLGYNYRMTNIQAAIGCAQFERIEKILKRKREIYLGYQSGLDSRFVVQEDVPGFRSSHWMNGFLAVTETQKERIRNHLSDHGVETRPFFPPMSSMPYNESRNLQTCLDLYARGIILPSYHLLTDGEIELIVGLVNQVE